MIVLPANIQTVPLPYPPTVTDLAKNFDVFADEFGRLVHNDRAHKLFHSMTLEKRFAYLRKLGDYPETYDDGSTRGTEFLKKLQQPSRE